MQLLDLAYKFFNRSAEAANTKLGTWIDWITQEGGAGSNTQKTKNNFAIIQNEMGNNAAAIADETSRATAAEQTLQQDIDDRLPGSNANQDMVKSVSAGADGDNVTITVTTRNLAYNTENTATFTLPNVTAEQAGVMTAAVINRINALQSEVEVMRGVGRVGAHLGATPSQTDLSNTWQNAKDAPPDETATVVNLDQDAPGGHAWTYMTGEAGTLEWFDRGIDTIGFASNTNVGVIMAGVNDGEVQVDPNTALASVIGWTALKNGVQTNTNTFGNVNAFNFDTDAGALQVRIGEIWFDIISGGGSGGNMTGVYEYALIERLNVEMINWAFFMLDQENLTGTGLANIARTTDPNLTSCATMAEIAASSTAMAAVAASSTAMSAIAASSTAMAAVAASSAAMQVVASSSTAMNAIAASSAAMAAVAASSTAMGQIFLNSATATGIAQLALFNSPLKKSVSVTVTDSATALYTGRCVVMRITSILAASCPFTLSGTAAYPWDDNVVSTTAMYTAKAVTNPTGRYSAGGASDSVTVAYIPID